MDCDWLVIQNELMKRRVVSGFAEGRVRFCGGSCQDSKVTCRSRAYYVSAGQKLVKHQLNTAETLVKHW